MLIKLIIILFFLNSNVFGQDTAYWKSGSESGLVNYTVQQSIDAKTWANIETVLPTKKNDSNVYNIPISQISGHWRIAANYNNFSFFTKDTLLNYSAVNSVTITNTKFSNSWFTDNLSFNVSSVKNVKYYVLQKSTNSGKTWTNITTITATAASYYNYSLGRFLSKKPLYRVMPQFVDGTFGNAIQFS